MYAKLIYRRTFTSSRHTADTYTNRMSAMWQTKVNNFLSLCLMSRIDTLYKSYGLTKHGDVTLQYSFYYVIYRHLSSAETRTLEIRINY